MSSSDSDKERQEGALATIADAGARLAYYSAMADMACTEAANLAALVDDHANLATIADAPQYVRDSTIATARIMATGAKKAARRASKYSVAAAEAARAVQNAAPLAYPGTESGYVNAHAFTNGACNQAHGANQHANQAHRHAIHARDVACTVAAHARDAAARQGTYAQAQSPAPAPSKSKQERGAQ